MGEAEVARIESALGHPLPGEYRDFLRRHADEVRRIKATLPQRAVLWTDADAIIRENLAARQRAAWMTVGEDEEPWPASYLVVGTNGAGDYWFVDRGGAMWGVGFYQHEAHEVEERYGSFEVYLAELRQEARDAQ
ncbi:SMI1 / KNR4 family protein [Gemmata obscuriglobus]|uniref:SMI1/KNR4 family protein n=1 Tax=Gemmata obscuriglobus TaxID=114 RepID=A0A2Z3H656_9BACT|nr:SMI1/KNR4 family protein [Gemmata obscuriglobus]AWM37548.1 SMI1/KNR4 family protein [Gemmata obscuriglobus]AWM40381.1 SMI1/KNR4 family protein [Gemmata obscuriglobus]AWM40397.1 SMI1/KNR4 family protein [Gemmata obscuriglobus]QEG26369.1 SMI1 / KNR4 family protein [Gemmata obscuriglobus]QEG26389.1 SMI1 / KNR4 family protein [Gemmata obscuriglobus]